MAKGKNVLTTGDVAKICNVAPRTVSKWFDSGQLKGYRIPGSKDRRIPMSELVRFMKVHNMPGTCLAADKTRILIVDDNAASASTLTEQLRSCGDYEVQTVHNNFETGSVVQSFLPHVLLINLLAEGIDATEICRSVHASGEFQTIRVIALANKLSDAESAALLQKGFDGYVTDVTDLSCLAEEIEKATAVIY